MRAGDEFVKKGGVNCPAMKHLRHSLALVVCVLMISSITAQEKPSSAQASTSAKATADKSEGKHANQRPVFPSSPATPWFLRVTFPGVLPAAGAVAPIVAATGLPVERVAEHGSANSRWLFIGPQGRRDIDAAIERLSNTHRIDAAAFRRI